MEGKKQKLRPRRDPGRKDNIMKTPNTNVYRVRRADGLKHTMTYDAVCKELGFIADIHFVRITTQGTITFTAGKPHEVRSLYQACMEKGFIPSSALVSTAKR